MNVHVCASVLTGTNKNDRTDREGKNGQPQNNVNLRFRHSQYLSFTFMLVLHTTLRLSTFSVVQSFFCNICIANTIINIKLA